MKANLETTKAFKDQAAVSARGPRARAALRGVTHAARDGGSGSVCLPAWHLQGLPLMPPACPLPPAPSPRPRPRRCSA